MISPRVPAPTKSRFEKTEFYIKNIINTPKNFNKIYDIVFHIRLGDKVNLNNTIKTKRLLNNILDAYEG